MTSENLKKEREENLLKRIITCTNGHDDWIIEGSPRLKCGKCGQLNVWTTFLKDTQEKAFQKYKQKVLGIIDEIVAINKISIGALGKNVSINTLLVELRKRIEE